MKPDNLETLTFSELLKRTPDPFEAVAVMGLRSRQIIDRRTAERMMLEQNMAEDEIDDYFEPLEVNEDYVEEVKEPLLAVQDFFADRLKWAFRPINEEAPGETDDSSGP